MSLSRRNFLGLGASLSAGAALGLTGCDRRSSLNLLGLRGALPPGLPRAFENRYSTTAIRQELLATPADLFVRLRDQPPREGLVSLGDRWLSTAIHRQLIAPLPAPLHGWERLPGAWRQGLICDAEGLPNPRGQIWGAPYRWGATVVAYRKAELQTAKLSRRDWGLLWEPALTQRLALPDDAREVIGLTLKELGHSYNTPDPTPVRDLPLALAQLQKQVRFYSTADSLAALQQGDVWVTLCSSTDGLQLRQRNPEVDFFYPETGTSLWQDCWVRPKAAPWSEASHDWIGFGWSAAIAPQFGRITEAASPALVSSDGRWQGEGLAPGVIPPAHTLAHSEFILPLDRHSQSLYQGLWEKMRRRQLSV